MKRARSDSVFPPSYSLRITTLASLCFFLLPLFCFGAVRYVPYPYPTIQGAIHISSHGDEIIVSAGTYVENIRFEGKDIVLRSTDPTSPSVVQSTIIDGNLAGSVVTFSGTEPPTCVLSGFTITNGYAPNGSGIYGNYTLATIQNNNISANTAYDVDPTGNGGGLWGCHGIIQNNTISDNLAYTGGGLSGCDGNIQNNIISYNSAYYGGGLFKCNGAIQNNIIRDNDSHCGAGIYQCQGIVQNNTILDNSADFGGGLYGCDNIIQNNRILGNSASTKGGGMRYCDGVIQNNTILGNRASSGGGLQSCDGTIQNNIISANSAGSGGGISYCSGTIQNNIISGNQASSGGGLKSCDGIIQNNTIYGNSASSDGGGFSDCKYSTIRNCIIWQNAAPGGAQLYECRTPFYSCVQDWVGGGTRNISFDPQLVDPANGDFRLRPNSLCIDAGCYVENLTQDFGGDLRPYDGSSQFRGDGSDFDIGADEFSGAIQLKDHNFELTEEGWTCSIVPAFFTPPECNYLQGQIMLTAQDNTNTFGYWASNQNAVPVIADCLYRARWTVATDITDPLAVPHMRLRVNSQNLQQADILAVSSAGDGSYAPTPDGRTYEMYFVPPESCLGKPEDQDDLILSFDILNFDPSDAAAGSLLLDSVVVEAMPLDTLSTPTVLRAWSFESGAEGWQFGSAPIFKAPVSDVYGSALWLIAQDNTNTFGFWSSPSEEVQVEANKLYRVQFDVSSDVIDREVVPCLRLRVHSEDFQSGVVKVISSVTGAEMSPTLEGRTYDLYFYPPQSLVGTDADSIIAAFDILNFDPSDAATGALMLNSVLVESFNSVP